MRQFVLVWLFPPAALKFRKSTHVHGGQLVPCALAHGTWDPIDPFPIVFWRQIETLTEARIVVLWLGTYGWVAMWLGSWLLAMAG